LQSAHTLVYKQSEHGSNVYNITNLHCYFEVTVNIVAVAYIVREALGSLVTEALGYKPEGHELETR
jgi:hypothetical protein